MNPPVIEKTESQKKLLAEVESQMLDDYCSAILILLWHGREMRFNAIYKELKLKGIKLSKPTLSDHLKHLINKEWIIRNAKDTQYVSYKLHNSIRLASKGKNWSDEAIDKLDTFVIEFSLDDKVDLVLCKILISKLKELVMRIEIESKIQNHSLSFNKFQSRLEENRFISDCIKEPENKKIFLERSRDFIRVLSDRKHYSNLVMKDED